MLKALLHFLLDNVFIQVGGKVFQQCVGIPMGTNCALLLAELLLHDYESSAMIRFSRTNGHPQAKSLEFIRRYIDDLISVNNTQFDKAIEKIYPSEWALKAGPPPPFEAILVISGRRALIFLFESSWKIMKNDTTFVRLRSGDHLGRAKMSKKGTSLRRI